MKKTKLALDLLEQEMELLGTDEMKGFVGGSTGYWLDLFNSNTGGTYMMNASGGWDFYQDTVTIEGTSELKWHSEADGSLDLPFLGLSYSGTTNRVSYAIEATLNGLAIVGNGFIWVYNWANNSWEDRTIVID